MSLSSATSRSDYVGNGAVDTYNYTFRIFDETDLVVIVRNTSDVETTLVLTTDYTVTGVGASGGGTVVLVNSGQAWLDAEGDLKTNYALTIRRVLPLVQETDIRNQGAFYPEIHEDQFDKNIMISQQQQDELNRSVKLPQTIAASSFDPELPSTIQDYPLYLIKINAAGDGWAIGPSAENVDNAQGYANAAQASAVSSAASATDSSQHATTASRWAKETSTTVVDADTLVDSNEYSSKEYAIGTQRRGLANGGSSKDWATYTGGTVDNSGYSAKYWAQFNIPTVTGSRGTPQSIVAGTGILFTGSSHNQTWFVQGSGGAVDISANPQIASGTSVGQRLMLIGRSDTNTVQLDDGSGLSINGTCILGEDQVIELFWDSANWVEINRSF